MSGLVFLLLVVGTGARVARAQTVIGSVEVQTSLGSFTVQLAEDTPVRDYARLFASLVRDRSFFHRSDKLIACDDSYCFVCDCVAGVCSGDPLMRSCTESYVEVTDQTHPSAVLHAGLFTLDGGNHLQEIGGSLPSDMQTAPGVFQNAAMTVAFVRKNGILTSEWIVNVQNNSELVRDDGLTFDDAEHEGAGAYLVFGRVSSGQDVVTALATLATADERNDPSLLTDGTPASITQELDQLPLTSFDDLKSVDITFCDLASPDPACVTPECPVDSVSEDGLSCLAPVCSELLPDDSSGMRYCAFPEEPNFPLITQATPAGLTLVNNGLGPPEPLNVLDYPDNPKLVVDVRDLSCPDDPSDPAGPCDHDSGVPTILDVRAGGSAEHIRVSDGSRLLAHGGAVSEVELLGSSSSGTLLGLPHRLGGTGEPDVGSLTVSSSADLVVEGGTVGALVAQDTATALVTGGAVGQIEAKGTSLVRLAGRGFTLDGAPAAFGPVASTTGTLAGALALGEPVSAGFQQENPQTIWLLDADTLEPRRPTVVVGAPGNAPDPVTMMGAVATRFRIGQTEVTNAQYVAFLSKKAFSDPHGLYAEEMGSDAHGGILRTGANGNYHYETIQGRADWPVVFVSRLDAMRYVNWLHNGATVQASTEDGAYTFSDETTVGPRNPGARYFLPNADEWYKAAYYDPASDTWFEYPTSSSSPPNTVAPGRDLGNAANLNGAAGPFAPVGSYRFSASPSGTLDQAGNVLEWLEDTLDLAGGSTDTAVSAASRQMVTPVASATTQAEDLGFRVPEPSAGSLAAAALATLAALRRRRRRRPAPGPASAR